MSKMDVDYPNGTLGATAGVHDALNSGSLP